MRAPTLFAALVAVAAAAPPAATRDRAPAPPPFAVETVLADSVRFAALVTDANLVGATITNYGFIGNNFVSRSPSLEYPLGTGYEHLVRGGLWIGAHAIDDTGAFVGVVTGAVDGAQGSAAQSATEFTPAGASIRIRSALPRNKFFDPAAVSEKDYIGEFSDRPAKRSLNNNERHRPMGLLVRQENYMWSFSDYQHVLIFHFTIKNIGPPLANVWVGLYTEFASGPKFAYGNWPPSSSGSSIGGWYDKKWIEYDAELRLFREHYCGGLPVPGGCNLHLAPYWIGKKLLGVSPGTLADRQVTLAAWDYSPGNTLRDEDTERYALMAAGTIQNLTTPDLMPISGDPVALLAVGPFGQILPDSTIVVDFAIVGGAEIPDVRRHAEFAQRAFDRGYIVPVPPPSPQFHVVAREGALDFYWDNSPEDFVDRTSPQPKDFEGYRLYVGEDRRELKLVAQFDKASAPHDTTGFNTGFAAVELPEPVEFNGVPYHYRHTIRPLRNGFKYFCAVTAYDLGNVEIESLESGVSQNKTLAIPGPAPGERGGRRVSVFPNPYRVEARWDQGRNVRDHYLWFTNLPERCALRIYTLSGDLVFETEFDGRTYAGEGARGVYDPKSELDVPPPTLSGTTWGWNLITRHGQAAATGLYLYAVEDRATGERATGKFLLVKSDREGF